MDINLSIVDQRLDGIVQNYGTLIANTLNVDSNSTNISLEDSTKIKSIAFVLLCVSTMLELPLDVAV
ncbi:hypothetical protein [Herpetosiphon giganteus]|uniref:hypothetical protein n=1 Tax=Herpetosiphon giganteus TaxID=2029754 RepID=UPI00195C4785|nr:hypothetical protein [Herpetosiphon giganteus]MBM7845872.1 hypothetical protein [Herpetosiphon giganteus]